MSLYFFVSVLFVLFYIYCLFSHRRSLKLSDKAASCAFFVESYAFPVCVVVACASGSLTAASSAACSCRASDGPRGGESHRLRKFSKFFDKPCTRAMSCARGSGCLVRGYSVAKGSTRERESFQYIRAPEVKTCPAAKDSKERAGPL